MTETEKETKTMVSIALAAKETGVPATTIYSAIERGEIPFITPIPGMKFKQVAVEDVQHWKEHPELHKPGRPRVSKKSE